MLSLSLLLLLTLPLALALQMARCLNIQDLESHPSIIVETHEDLQMVSINLKKDGLESHTLAQIFITQDIGDTFKNFSILAQSKDALNLLSFNFVFDRDQETDNTGIGATDVTGDKREVLSSATPLQQQISPPSFPSGDDTLTQSDWDSIDWDQVRREVLEDLPYIPDSVGTLSPGEDPNTALYEYIDNCDTVSNLGEIASKDGKGSSSSPIELNKPDKVILSGLRPVKYERCNPNGDLLGEYLELSDTKLAVRVNRNAIGMLVYSKSSFEIIEPGSYATISKDILSILIVTEVRNDTLEVSAYYLAVISQLLTTLANSELDKVKVYFNRAQVKLGQAVNYDALLVNSTNRANSKVSIFDHHVEHHLMKSRIEALALENKIRTNLKLEPGNRDARLKGLIDTVMSFLMISHSTDPYESLKSFVSKISNMLIDQHNLEVELQTHETKKNRKPSLKRLQRQRGNAIVEAKEIMRLKSFDLYVIIDKLIAFHNTTAGIVKTLETRLDKCRALKGS